jgi:hypothetical protein
VTDQELYDYLYDNLCRSKEAHYEAIANLPACPSHRDWKRVPPVFQVEAYAELAKDVRAMSFSGAPPNLPAGTTVRVVTVSRLGDMGVTRNLNALHGYEARVPPGKGYLINCRLTRKPAKAKKEEKEA